MTIGLGLYRHMLTREYYDFAGQAGDQPWGVAADLERLWTGSELVQIRRAIQDAGLTLAAIENFYSRQGKIAYLDLRNVGGTVPHYPGTFIDEGDVDMVRILTILKRNRFDGVIIPDHTPQMSCPAPWHAGMAHTLGFVLAALKMLDQTA